MDLPDPPTEAVDLVDARDGAQPGRHVPVLQGPQLHQVVPIALERVLEDLPEPRADGAQLGFDARGQVLPRQLEALEDELSGEVGVDPVLEDDHH